LALLNIFWHCQTKVWAFETDRIFFLNNFFGLRSNPHQLRAMLTFETSRIFFLDNFLGLRSNPHQLRAMLTFETDRIFSTIFLDYTAHGLDLDVSFIIL